MAMRRICGFLVLCFIGAFTIRTYAEEVDWWNSSDKLSSFSQIQFDHSIYQEIDGVLYKEEVLYRYPGLRSVQVFDIPEGVVDIDLNAFVGVEPGTINTLVLPSTCVSIGGEYAGCGTDNLGYAQNIQVADDNPVYSSVDGLLVSKDQSTLIYYPTGRNEDVFHVPETIQTIGSYSCSLSTFKEAVFPEKLQTIEDHAFFMSQMKELVLPDSLKRIGISAFEASDCLETVTVPSSVTTIESQAFAQCFHLTAVVLQEGIETIDDYAFYASPIAELFLPASLTSIGEDITAWQNSEGDIVTANYTAPDNSYAASWIAQTQSE